MPFKRSRTHEEPEPEKDDEVAPEVPTTFATKGVGCPVARRTTSTWST